MSLTTLIAIWGAGLSTYLALWRNCPFAHIRHDDFASKGLIDVLIENRSDVDVIVRGAWVLFGKNVEVSIGDSVRDIVYSKSGRSKMVRAGANCSVTFHLPVDAGSRQLYLALISWRRLSGLTAPTIPLVIRLPRAELERLPSGS